MSTPTLAVWKFASCDGCHLTLLDCEDELLTLAGQVQIATFLEASSAIVGGPYEVLLVAGSITTEADERRIREIRKQSKVLVTIGACATAGGVHALRNFADAAEFASVVYAKPEYIDTLAEALKRSGVAFADAIEKVVVFRDELTLHIRRDWLPQVAQRLPDEPGLRFVTVSRCQRACIPTRDAVYPLKSITHNRRILLEVAVPNADLHIPSLFGVYPINDWYERETYDFLGIIFDGHPALARIEMPDDSPGYPQRKDYPLGGIPVEYKSAQILPPDERRVYN